MDSGADVTGKHLTFSWIIGVAAAFPLVLLPGDAHAHAANRAFVLLLPTDIYLVGGGIVVALTFVVLAVMPVRGLSRIFAARRHWGGSRLRPDVVVSCGSFGLFAVLIAAGFLGTRDPLENPLPIVVWTLLWVGFTLATALLGDLWRLVNPWSGPYWVVRRLFASDGQSPRLRLPGWLGYWPALAGLFVFIWFELVDIAPNDPVRLAKLAGAYWLGTFIGMLLFGEEPWRRHGEIFAVFFGFIARLAPVWREGSDEGGQWVAGVPGARLVVSRAIPLSGALFILLALASVSFDGLSRTFWWLSLIGVNPLEFPGRSAVVGANTLGLLATFSVLAAAFFVAVLVGRKLAGAEGSPRNCLGRLVLSIMPIALGYHFAHYMTVLLVNGQYALLAANDPFATGFNLLGLGEFRVTTSFLNNFGAVELIWRAQAAGIVLAHVVAILVAHGIAFDIYGDPRRAAVSQVPLALLMIGYTVFGLWLLATPVGS